MREVLFRGKTPTDYEEGVFGEWVTGFYTRFNETEHRIYSGYAETDCGDYYPDWFNVLPETVGQYTGLTDKNGKKIFEGDIMPVWENGEKYHYKVIYNGDCFMLSMLDSEQGSYPLSVKNGISEIIGNIHDNPELLKGGVQE